MWMIVGITLSVIFGLMVLFAIVAICYDDWKETKQKRRLEGTTLLDYIRITRRIYSKKFNLPLDRIVCRPLKPNDLHIQSGEEDVFAVHGERFVLITGICMEGSYARIKSLDSAVLAILVPGTDLVTPVLFDEHDGFTLVFYDAHNERLLQHNFTLKGYVLEPEGMTIHDKTIQQYIQGL